MWRQLAFVIALALACCSSFGQVDNESLRNHVQQEYGRIIPQEEAPALYANILEVFNNLARGQEALAEGSSVAINSLYIVESDVLNAFVNKESRTGVRISRHHVFITTKMIEALMQNETPEDGLRNIAGALAHELGHPMDTIYEDRHGISIANHYGSSGDQGLEIRADLDAVRILRAANYPTNALYESLKKLFRYLSGSKGDSAAGAAISSHPQKDFRLTTSRLYLTMDRLLKGLLLKPKSFVMQNHGEFAAELKKLLPVKGRFPYQVPTSFEEVVSRIEKLANIQEGISFDHLNLEYNRLILSGNRFLEDMEKTNHVMTDPEKDAFKTFFGFLVKFPISLEGTYKSVSIATPQELRNTINPQSGVSGLEKSLSHESYLLRLKIYQSDMVRGFVQKHVDDLPPAKNRPEHFNALLGLTDFLNAAHPRLVFDVFKKEIS